jgi:VCBS repeat-containing protein
VKKALFSFIATILILVLIFPVSAVILAVSTGTWSSTGDMLTGGSNIAIFLHNGKILAVGKEIYDPATGIWSAAKSMSISRSSYTATLLTNGKVLVAGGNTGITSCELYDPDTDAWSATGNMISGRTGHISVLLSNGKVLVAGGYWNDGVNNINLQSAELYDPGTGTWSVTGNMMAPGLGPWAILLPNGKVFVLGEPALSDPVNPVAGVPCELFDPNTGTWSNAGEMRPDHFYITPCLLTNGKVLLSGGRWSLTSTTNQCDLYDPDTGTWVTTGSMQYDRQSHTATLLPDGKVLVAGGEYHTANPAKSVATAELYDPKTGTWSDTSSMNISRFNHSATLLPIGVVLVAGGAHTENLSSSPPTKSCELYTSATNAQPVATSQTLITNEDTPVNITLAATDVDNDPLNYSVVSGTLHGVLSGTAPNLTYTPTTNFNGGDSFTFKANDGTVDSNIATITITITAVNDVPSFTKGSNQTVLEDTGAQTVAGWATSISAGPADESGQALNFIVNNNNNALFSSQPAIAANGSLTYTPAANANGSATVTVSLHDNGGTANGGIDTSVQQTFTITVTAVNDVPVAVNDSYSVTENSVLNVSAPGVLANDTDIDNAVLTALKVSDPAHGTLTLNTDGSFSYKPANNYTGNDSFTYKVNDGKADSNVATVSITVNSIPPSSAASIGLAVAPAAGISVDTPLATQPVISVVDKSNKPVSGVTVTASRGTGTGVLRGTLNATSNENGLAIFTNLGYNKSGEAFSVHFASGTLSVDSGSLGPLNPGTATQVRVETALSGSGTIVPSQNLVIGNSLPMYAIARDQYSNYVSNPGNAAWSLANKTGGVSVGDLSPLTGASTVMTGHQAGTAIINASVTGLVIVDSGTITVIPPVINGGGNSGGGSGGGGSIPEYNIVNVSGLTANGNFKVNSSGLIQNAVQLKTTDGRVTFDITAGTVLKKDKFDPVSILTANVLTSFPEVPSDNALILAYKFGPDGATFNPGLTLTMNYDPTKLPKDVNEKDLYIAFWDGTKWQSVGGTIDTSKKTITVLISHFSNYALMGKVVTPQVSTPTPTASPTPSTLPTSTSTQTPIPSPVVASKQIPEGTVASAPTLTPSQTAQSTSTSPVTSPPVTSGVTQRPISSLTLIIEVIVGLLALVIVTVLVVSRKRKTIIK